MSCTYSTRLKGTKYHIWHIRNLLLKSTLSHAQCVLYFRFLMWTACKTSSGREAKTKCQTVAWRCMSCVEGRFTRLSCINLTQERNASTHASWRRAVCARIFSSQSASFWRHFFSAYSHDKFNICENLVQDASSTWKMWSVCGASHNDSQQNSHTYTP